MKRILLCICVSAAIACGGSDDGSSGNNSVNGTIHGKSFSAQDAISNSVVYSTTSGGTEALIVITNATGICADIQANKEPKNLQILLITLADLGAGGAHSAPTAPGTYSLDGTSTTKAAGVIYEDTDATCNTVDADSALSFSGTVTLTSISNGAYAGTFDVIMSSGTNGSQQDHITGSFGASACTGVNSSSSNSTCI